MCIRVQESGAGQAEQLCLVVSTEPAFLPRQGGKGREGLDRPLKELGIVARWPEYFLAGTSSELDHCIKLGVVVQATTALQR